MVKRKTDVTVFLFDMKIQRFSIQPWLNNILNTQNDSSIKTNHTIPVYEAN